MKQRLVECPCAPGDGCDGIAVRFRDASVFQEHSCGLLVGGIQKEQCSLHNAQQLTPTEQGQGTLSHQEWCQNSYKFDSGATYHGTDAGHLNVLLSTASSYSSCWSIPEHRKLSRKMDHSKFEDNLYCIARLCFTTNKS